ncbi:unnamed protein product [Acanthoscelides obtectus]|uniref:Uncharacterized protein n=1 Tax=Acanthoscelides obtectus TaxID=200917 RepID=A0A9P0Q3Y6_ACAOB|nr:unnamed protein product [Acanthoscelides obtectus]CAK1624235.1 hypothetical protein AOBTE_LOCUS2428 [Acanthoscelides obtectus]
MEATKNDLDDVAVLHNDLEAIIADLEGDGIQLAQMTTDIELEIIKIRPAKAAVVENTTDKPTTTVPAMKVHTSPSKSLNQTKHVFEKTKNHQAAEQSN